MDVATTVSVVAAVAAVLAAVVAVVQARYATIQARESRRAADIAEAQHSLESRKDAEQRRAQAYAAARAVLDSVHRCIDEYRALIRAGEDERGVESVRRARLDLFTTYRNSLSSLRGLPMSDKLNGLVREMEHLPAVTEVSDARARQLRHEATRLGSEVADWLLGDP